MRAAYSGQCRLGGVGLVSVHDDVLLTAELATEPQAEQDGAECVHDLSNKGSINVERKKNVARLTSAGAEGSASALTTTSA